MAHEGRVPLGRSPGPGWWAGSTFKARGSCSRRLAILTTLLQRKSKPDAPRTTWSR